jgi:hypothetical protein
MSKNYISFICWKQGYYRSDGRKACNPNSSNEFFAFFLVVLQTGVWSLGLLGRCSTTWAMPQLFYALVIFWIRPPNLSHGSLWPLSSYLCLPHIWYYRGTRHHSQLGGWDEDLASLPPPPPSPPPLPRTMILLISTFHVTGIIDVCHHTQS